MSFVGFSKLTFRQNYFLPFCGSKFFNECVNDQRDWKSSAEKEMTSPLCWHKCCCCCCHCCCCCCCSCCRRCCCLCCHRSCSHLVCQDFESLLIFFPPFFSSRQKVFWWKRRWKEKRGKGKFVLAEEIILSKNRISEKGSPIKIALVLMVTTLTTLTMLATLGTLTTLTKVTTVIKLMAVTMVTVVRMVMAEMAVRAVMMAMAVVTRPAGSTGPIVMMNVMVKRWRRQDYPVAVETERSNLLWEVAFPIQTYHALYEDYQPLNYKVPL